MAEERLSRRHAAADDSVGADRRAARRRIGGHCAVYRRQDRHHDWRRPDRGDPGVRAVSNHACDGDRRRLHDPREQLHAVDCDRRRLHGLADDRQPRGLHAGDRPDHSVVAHGGVDVRRVDHRRSAGVSDEAALHQRGTAAVSRRPRQRRRARRAVHRRRQGRHVQGAAARLHRASRGPVSIHHQRRLDEAAAVQDPAPRSVGRPERAVDIPRAARLVLLRGGCQGKPIYPDDPRHRHPPARAATDARRRDARHRRTDRHRWWRPAACSARSSTSSSLRRS